MAVNHPGATGSIASRIAAEAPRDGYTLYMPVLSTFVALPGLAPNVPVQLPRDFTAIGFAAENPMFIVAAPYFSRLPNGGLIVTPAAGQSIHRDLIIFHRRYSPSPTK